MQDSESISGIKRVRIFQQLQKDKTVLNMHVLGRHYERLTIVTGVAQENGADLFLVDYPTGFREQIPDAEGMRVFFECTGQDKLPYSFRSVIWKVGEQDIWVRFPGTIKRLQRRRYFRQETLLGAKLTFSAGGKLYVAGLINVSLGGVLMRLEQDKKGGGEKEFPVGEVLSGLSLMLGRGGTGVHVRIKNAEIRRIEKDPVSGKNHYGIQFMNLERREERTLAEYIFRRQREILRKRSFIFED